VDNSDHRQAGGWFAACIGEDALVEIRPREKLPGTTAAWRAVILSGSERSVFEDTPWLEEELCFVRRVVDAGTPLLGVCFGHQVIFRALYGKDVLTRRAAPEVGWPAVKLRGDALFEGVGDTIYPYNFHFDEVVSVPKGWSGIAASERCQVHAVRHLARPVFGLQFHPEVTPADGIANILRYGALLSAHGIDADTLTTAGYGPRRYYPAVIRNFITSSGGVSA